MNTPGSYVRTYLDKRDLYFKSGERVTVYTDSKDVDVTSANVQKRLSAFNTKLKNCEGCAQKFTVAESFDSWYASFAAYSQQNTGENGQKVTGVNACEASWLLADKTIVWDKFMPCLA